MHSTLSQSVMPPAIGASPRGCPPADAPGNDHQNLNGEYAVLENRTSQPLDLSGWTLCDAARHCFTFPEAAVLTAMGQVVLYTGRGLSDGISFFMGCCLE